RASRTSPSGARPAKRSALRTRAPGTTSAPKRKRPARNAGRKRRFPSSPRRAGPCTAANASSSGGLWVLRPRRPQVAGSGESSLRWPPRARVRGQGRLTPGALSPRSAPFPPPLLPREPARKGDLSAGPSPGRQSMAEQSPAQHPSPEHIREALSAYQQTASLKAALELDLFTAVGEGNQTAPAIAKRCAASERGTRILSDYLVVIGFLTKEGQRYGLTADSAMFLDRRSPTCLAGAVAFLNSPHLTDGFKDLASAVRKGGTVVGKAGTLEPEHPVWVEFARAMAGFMALPAELIARLVGAVEGRKSKVLDIAAGHGLFGITIAKHNPHAEIVAVDWPGVLAVAQENARAAGVEARYRTFPGSAFEVDFGNDYDLVLLTNFLHHFDVPTCEKFLRKVHRALAPGGRAVTFEFIPNEDRVSPPVAAKFSLIMLSTTPSGDAYTFSEYESMFRNAGFQSNELHPLPPTPGQVVVSYR